MQCFSHYYVYTISINIVKSNETKFQISSVKQEENKNVNDER
jgi:hypothetical protein